MTKPRCLIHMHYMALGGAERALLGLLSSIDTERVDVDLFLNQHTGEFMQLIPNRINLLPENDKYAALEIPIKTALKRGHVGIALMRLFSKINKKIYFFWHPDEKDDDGYMAAKWTSKLLPQINPIVEYDVAISFLTPHIVVRKKVKAKKYVAWIHTDYSTLLPAVSLSLPFWLKYDKIVSISNDITKTFLKVYPSLENKIVEIENILSPDFIKQQANLFDVCSEMPKYDDHGNHIIRVLSIGRFSYPKNFDNIPKITRYIVENYNPNFKWYIIGFGIDEALIRQEIAKTSMEKHVIILGKKTNPYPYIKACDIYVQPSRYEGKCVSVREAQILGKPVIITRYPTSNSQLQDGLDGIICDMDNKSVACSIIDLVNDSAKQKKLINYLDAHNYGNENEVEKLYQLIGL